MVELDPSILELADLPAGWIAEREGLDGAWNRTEQSKSTD
jgi:hypothetical protein